MEQRALPSSISGPRTLSGGEAREVTIATLHSGSELEDFFENAAVALHLVANDGTILRANRAELDLLGYAADEYVGRNIREFHADAAAIDDILNRLSRHEQLQHYRARLRAKDGSMRWVEITSNVRSVEGRFLNTRCITIDVTEKVEAEELLREQEQRLALTYHSAGVGIVEADAEGRLLRVNGHLCRLLACTQEDLVGRSIFDQTFPSDVEADRTKYRQQVAGEINSYTIEKRFVRKDGSLFWAVVTSSSVYDGSGRFHYAVRVQHDITERKEIEATLAQRAEEQAALHQLTEMLQHAYTREDVYEAALDDPARAKMSARFYSAFGRRNHEVCRVAGLVGRISKRRGRPFALVGSRPRSAANLHARCGTGRTPRQLETRNPNRRHRRGLFYSDNRRRASAGQVHGLFRRAARLLGGAD